MKHVLWGLFLLLSACSNPVADRIYVGGVIWTGNPDAPTAQALAIRGTEVMFVGDANAAEGLRGPETEMIDLDGHFVVPGFIDNHTHFLSGGFNLASVHLRDAASEREFAQRMADFAATQPAGRWIQGGDWDHELWGGELPDRSWIDAATPNNPVFVQRLDGHMALVNTQVLEIAGITADTPDPDGGTIERRPDGSPTGVLKDEAMSLVYPYIPEPDIDARLEMLGRAQAHALSLGVTQIHDVGSYGGWPDLEAFRAAEERGLLKLRVYSLVNLASWEQLRNYVAAEGHGDDRVWWGGLKGFVDGSLGSTTALFYDAYLDEPDTKGLLVTDTTALRQRIMDADAAGLHVAVHAIGDKANDWLLDVYASTERKTGRWRIEHAQHLSEEAIPRFSEMDVIPSMQPYHAIDDGRWAHKRIGERVATTYAFRDLLDAEARLTFGSDWTVAPINPLLGIYAAVTRRTLDGANPDGWVPEQRISVEEALKSYTVNNAYAGFSDGFTGTLRPGYRADFVVLSENLLQVDPVRIPEVEVVTTVIGGEVVFEK